MREKDQGWKWISNGKGKEKKKERKRGGGKEEREEKGEELI